VIRWLRFNTVGLMGVGVQIASLAFWNWVGLHYLAATALAVETTILHNYWWHRRWTFKERTRAGESSLWRFQVSNGLLSLGSNLLLMRVLTGWAGVPAVPANLTTIGVTGLLNFWVSERWVFLRESADSRARS
jgi:putative flippase GtrA